MDKLKINEIKAIDCDITLFDQEFTLRKFSFLDQNWIEESFPEEVRKTLFTDNMKDSQLARIVYHQMTPESQSRILPLDVEFYDEDTGTRVNKLYTGWRSLLGRMAGIADKTEAYRGILTIIGLSQPVLEKMFTQEELKEIGLDKESKQKKKKVATGRKSSK